MRRREVSYRDPFDKSEAPQRLLLNVFEPIDPKTEYNHFSAEVLASILVYQFEWY